MEHEKEQVNVAEKAVIKHPLLTIEDIQRRMAVIEGELKEVNDRAERDGHEPDKLFVAKLHDEHRELWQVLKVASLYRLEDIQRELDTQDPVVEELGHQGLDRYSFYVLAHAEKVLEAQDKDLSARVDLGERVIEQWEENWGTLSFEKSQSVYGIIRDKSIPLDVLEERIRKSLIRADEKLQELLVDIGGKKCLKCTEWKDGTDSYVLGNAVDSGSFYYAEVNGSICNAFEYDFRPSKEKVEDDWLNLESMREINRQEALAQAWPGDREDASDLLGVRTGTGDLYSAAAQENMNMDDKDILDVYGLAGRDETFRYQLLSRMQADCEYYLGYGNRHPKYLWAETENDQIACMKALWRSFPEDGKPEWLPFDKILEYEGQMVGIEVLFTFGTAKQFPFELGYVSITAPSVKIAIEEFRRNYPDHNEGLLNCADYYYSAESVARIKEHGNGAGCHRAIVVTSMDKSVDELIADGKSRVSNPVPNDLERDLEY